MVMMVTMITYSCDDERRGSNGLDVDTKRSLKSIHVNVFQKISSSMHMFVEESGI